MSPSVCVRVALAPAFHDCIWPIGGNFGCTFIPVCPWQKCLPECFRSLYHHIRCLLPTLCSIKGKGNIMPKKKGSSARKKRKGKRAQAQDTPPSFSFSSSSLETSVTDPSRKRRKSTRSPRAPPHRHQESNQGKHSTRGKEEAGGDSKDAPAPGGAADDDRTLQPIQSLDESDPPAYVEEGGKEGDILPMKVSSHKVSSEVRPATST